MKLTGFSRVSKDLIIKQVEKEANASSTLIVTQHAGVPASNLDKLRAKLRKEKSRYLVVKNSLGRIVFSKDKLKPLSESVTGACGIAFSNGDPVGASKVLVDFAKENETFKIQAALVDGQVVTATEIKTLASLPSRKVLIGKVVGGIQAPISGFVGVLSGTLRKLVTALDAIAKKKA